MATFAIGDVQGCYSQLEQLLERIQYDRARDVLWFTGDLVNRGPDSLRTLQLISELPETTVAVLGNHDLALLAADIGAVLPQPGDTYQEILNAPQRDELLSWLRHRPLMHYDPKLRFALCHAGIYPLWDLAQAQSLAREVESILQGPTFKEALQAMFGNYPNSWNATLTGWDRFRFIINAFTRMRFCTIAGMLDLQNKSETSHAANFMPWFSVPSRRTSHDKVIFGHWAALAGVSNTPGVYAIDTGCVWGNALTAICLETEQRFHVSCKQ